MINFLRIITLKDDLRKYGFSFFLVAYLLTRALSFFFQPGSFFNTLIAGIILFSAMYFLLRRDERGWYIVAGELILGGAGHFYELGGLSLRTWLLVGSLGVYFGQRLVRLSARDSSTRPPDSVGMTKKKWILKQVQDDIVGLLLLAVVVFSAFRGYLSANSPKLIFSDAIPYLFFLYYFPLRDLLKNRISHRPQTHPPAGGGVIKNLVIAAVVGNLIFVGFTFIVYSAGFFHLQDVFYHWFRDVAGGKITDYGFNFYRIVLNEQLLLAPLFLLFLHNVIARRPMADAAIPMNNSITQVSTTKRWDCFAMLAMTIILSINFTRIYILALPLGLLVLFTKQNWKRWLLYSTSAMFFFILSFASIHFAASRGQSFGLELFGLRLRSIAAPQIEESSLSRMLLLPPIWEKIKARPLLGNGLGDTVTVYSPVVKQNITTPQFDWGYLEIWDEMGLVGLAIWLSFLGYLLFSILKSDAENKTGLLASMVALLIINITSPALFHVLGILWLTIILATIICHSKRNEESLSITTTDRDPSSSRNAGLTRDDN